MIEVERVDFVRIPVTDIEKAKRFYGEVLGLEQKLNSPGDDWIEFETGNVTLAVMTPHARLRVRTAAAGNHRAPRTRCRRCQSEA
jgi:catechol 2,3-dioxygenase-like lactoylglutathione lyase family enzyme